MNARELLQKSIIMSLTQSTPKGEEIQRHGTSYEELFERSKHLADLQWKHLKKMGVRKLEIENDEQGRLF